ncbi:hypothetical protein NA57DRAFT_81783 [Rhizodiscina lignyota]|uniref:Uncharacterized protein n=1 Tax=Rhizodiscina lignyota TaxID=1504668 RepID=A0A9P4M134_9PEZI|nr:hypothetical protein NA57DRAFT_81783 [Rhizodiscina lignyota]
MRKRRRSSVAQNKVVLRSPKKGKNGAPAAIEESSTSHGHTTKTKPRPVQIRRPLQVHEQRQKLRARVKHSRREATNQKKLQRTLQQAGRSFTGSDIHPITMISWLASEEPFHADMLRDAYTGDVKGMPGAEAAALAADMETLVEQFKNTDLSNTSLLANPLIDIPKGFAMQLQLVCFSQDYGAVIAEMHKREGAIYHMGFMKKPGTQTQRKYGFDPTEMLKKHAISFPPGYGLQSPTLDNEIHPLLQLDNFHGCPSDIYDQLKPGLRLATTLLLHRSTAHFWHTIAFGERTLDEAMTLTNGYRCFRLASTLPYSSENATRFVNLLNSLVSTVHIHFSLWPLPARSGLYAGMSMITDYKRGDKYYNPFTMERELQRKCRICLHTDFYTTAARLAKLRNPDRSLVLRFNFFLAITVCHELAHFVEMNGPHEGAAVQREAYWGKKGSRPEMGSAFEEAVFGGKVHPIASRVDCAWGCTVYDNPDSIVRPRRDLMDHFDAEADDARKGRKRASSDANLALLCDLTKFSTVPMTYIARLQQRETWEAGKFDEDDLDAGKALIIPRDGAEAVSVPVFDTMVWDDDIGNTVTDENEGRDTPFQRLPDGSIVKFQAPKLEKPKSADVAMDGLGLHLEVEMDEEEDQDQESESESDSDVEVKVE